MSCLGDVVAALVDGELDHPARERAQRHIAHCGTCRTEVDAQRRLKSRLSALVGEPGPSAALTARLVGLAVPGTDPLRDPAWPAPRPAAPHPAAARSRGRRMRRRATVGSGLAVLGLGAALALGGPQAQAPSTPVDPGTDAFVADFVSTTGELGDPRTPVLEPGGAGHSR